MKTHVQSSNETFQPFRGIHPGATAVMAAAARSFPDEYKQSLWDSVDKRFLSVLTVTFLLSYSLFGTFISIYQPNLTTADYNKYLKSRTSPVEIRLPTVTKPEENLTKPIDLKVTILATETQNQSSKTVEQRQEEKKTQLSDISKTYQDEIASKTAGKLAEIARITGPKQKRTVEDNAGTMVSMGASAVDFSKPVGAPTSISPNTRFGNATRASQSGTYSADISSVKTSSAPNLTAVKTGGTINTQEFIKKNPGLTASGSRSGEALSKSIESYTRSVQGCYESHKIKDPSLKGMIEFELLISPDGKVTRTSILANTMNNDGVGRCIMNRMRTWNFGGSADGKVQLVKIPYVFSD